MAAAALSRDPPDPPGDGQQWGALAADVEAKNQRLRELCGELEWADDPDPGVLDEIARTLHETIQLVEEALAKYRPAPATARHPDAGANPVSAFRQLKPRGRTVYSRVRVLYRSVAHRTVRSRQMAEVPTPDFTEEETGFQDERERVVGLLEAFLDEWEDFVRGLPRA
jgi:hypothetical protein